MFSSKRQHLYWLYYMQGNLVALKSIRGVSCYNCMQDMLSLNRYIFMTLNTRRLHIKITTIY